MNKNIFVIAAVCALATSCATIKTSEPTPAKLSAKLSSLLKKDGIELNIIDNAMSEKGELVLEVIDTDCFVDNARIVISEPENLEEIAGVLRIILEIPPDRQPDPIKSIIFHTGCEASVQY